MSLGDHNRRGSESTIRDIAFVAAIVVAFLVVVLRLYNIQVMRGQEFALRSQENFIQTKRLEHDRGEIVDRDGQVLVANRSSFNVYITPAFFPPTRQVVRKIGRVVGLSGTETKDLRVALERGAEEDGPPLLIAGDIGEDAARRIREIQGEFDVPLEAVVIMASSGAVGAISYDAYLDPKTFPTRQRVFARLRDILGLSPGEFKKLNRSAARVSGLARYQDIIVRPDIGPTVGEALRFEIELGNLPGVSLRAAKARDYRFGRRAAHTLGYVNELSQKEYDEKREHGYRIGDLIGRRGVERTYEEDLRGIDGYETVVVDSKGRSQLSKFAKQLRGTVGDRKEPRAGNRVVLSLDMELQRAAEDAFPGRAGAAVVIEVNTGRVLVLTSTPTFDPNLVSGYFEKSERRRLHKIGKLRPWRFRAIQDHFAPGSTFKPVTLLAAMKKKAVSVREGIFCPGWFRIGNAKFRCWKDAGHGRIDSTSSLARSCDTYYYTLGSRIGLDPIAEMANSLGFGTRTGLPIHGESKGIMPTAAWYKKHFNFYSVGAAVNASIGQGAVASTPLQLAVAYATIANGGTVYEPQIALRIEAFDGSAVREFPPVVRRRLEIPEAHLTAVRKGLFNVVNDRSGTAYWRRIKDVEGLVSGKTGTAQVAKLGAKRLKAKDMAWEVRDHAWFAAYAPSENPQIAVAVLNEHGGHGGSGAAPTAMAVIKAWYEKQQKRAAISSEADWSFAYVVPGDGDAR